MYQQHEQQQQQGQNNQQGQGQAQQQQQQGQQQQQQQNQFNYVPPQMQPQQQQQQQQQQYAYGKGKGRGPGMYVFFDDNANEDADKHTFHKVFAEASKAIYWQRSRPEQKKKKRGLIDTGAPYSIIGMETLLADWSSNIEKDCLYTTEGIRKYRFGDEEIDRYTLGTAYLDLFGEPNLVTVAVCPGHLQLLLSEEFLEKSRTNIAFATLRAIIDGRRCFLEKERGHIFLDLEGSTIVERDGADDYRWIN